jgi:ribonuclease P protein component
MLSRENRLLKSQDFAAVNRRGRSFSFGNIFLKFKARERMADKTRVGISVGLKFSKKAVERNRIKRQLRAILRKNLSQIAEGFDIMIVPKKIEKTVLSEQLENDLKIVFKKAGLIK